MKLHTSLKFTSFYNHIHTTRPRDTDLKNTQQGCCACVCVFMRQDMANYEFIKQQYGGNLSD